jgi:serine phosphatase RsbU (regulator of sigma subunit)
MEEQPRQFAVKILIFHSILLVVVLSLIIVASAAIYWSTREDAVTQAQVRQELLANETCRGIETYYSSIINDLAWIQPHSPGTQPSDPGQPPVGALERIKGNGVGQEVIAAQLGTRVSNLFVYDKQTGAVTSLLPTDSKLKKSDLSNEIVEWLHSVDQTKVSRFMKLNGEGVSLVAVPFNASPGGGRGRGGRGGNGAGAGRRGGRSANPAPARGAAPQSQPPPLQPSLLVAAVSGAKIESNFQPLLSNQNNASVTLVDADLQVVTSSNPALEGANLADLDNPELRSMIDAYHQTDPPPTITRQFLTPIATGGAKLGRMVTLAPVGVADDEWSLLFADPLANIDAQVNTLFRRAALWAGFVALSIAAILVSTAAQMIRHQSRLERVQHQIITRELTQARRIQEQWLPDISTAPPQMDVAALNQPASHISGDFYNWFQLPDGREVVVVGDVTGHGMAAAFLMATTQLLVRNTMTIIADPGKAMEEINRQLTSEIFHGQFVTMLIMALDFERKQMDIASAGHPPPLLVQAGAVAPLKIEPQLVLGVEKNVSYPTERLPLPEVYSLLLLYTDGVLDARRRSDKGDERFGSARLREALGGHAINAQEMVDAVSAAVTKFRDGIPLDDDLTLVGIQLRRVPPRVVVRKQGAGGVGPVAPLSGLPAAPVS